MEKRVATLGVFVALAMVFSYLEVLIPIPLAIPGVKLGIANLVIVSGLYLLKTSEVFVISMLRIVLMGLLFGNGASLLYSLSGGLLSFLMMYILKRTKVFSILGVSIIGGVFHNIGQIMMAAILLSNIRIISYLPVLLLAGLLTGAIIGILSKRIVGSLKSFHKAADIWR